MSIVSVHIADVGFPKSLCLIRHPRPASIPGLLHANAGVAATFGTTPARPSPGRVGLIAFWHDDAALSGFEGTNPLAATLGGGLVVHAPVGQRRRSVCPCYCRRMPRTDRVSRVMRAPSEQVYGALVDPEALLTWLPPEGMRGRFERFDARPGGSYRLVLTYDDGGNGRGKATSDSDVVEARFMSLVPGVNVVQAVDFVSDDPSFAGTMTVTWDIRSLGEGTLVEITADAVPAGISADDHAAGMASSLANLAAYLESRNDTHR